MSLATVLFQCLQSTAHLTHPQGRQVQNSVFGEEISQLCASQPAVLVFLEVSAEIQSERRGSAVSSKKRRHKPIRFREVNCSISDCEIADFRLIL